MRAAHFRTSERLVVEVVEGDSIRETIQGIVARYPAGAARLELTARGRIDAARLVGPAVAPKGVLAVIQLTGTASSAGTELVLLATAADGAMVSGKLVDARAVELELTCEVLERADAPAEASRLPSAPPMSWGAVAAASARSEADALDAAIEDEESSPSPELGDTIEHPTFGACVVEKIDDDEEFVMVRNSAQRLLRLSLDVLRLVLVGEQDGQRRFRSRPRGVGRERT